MHDNKEKTDTETPKEGHKVEGHLGNLRGLRKFENSVITSIRDDFILETLA